MCFPSLSRACLSGKDAHARSAKKLVSVEQSTRRLLDDRLLASQRKQSQRGVSTTRAGMLLKQQIPIRIFEEWQET